MAYQFRGKVNMAAAVNKAKGGFEKDPTRFQYKIGDKGTFTAVLRLLPAPDSDVGFSKVLIHKFKDRANRDISIACPKMDGRPCPICAYVQNLYNIGSEQSEKLGSKYNTSKTFYANVLVKTNVSAPETVGKVLMLAYKKEINKIITGAMEGDPDAGIAPINVFDYFEGADLVFRAVQKGEWPTYVTSKFEGASALSPEEAERVDQLIMPVNKFLEDAKAKIKSTEEILTMFRKATGTDISEYADVNGTTRSDDSEGSEGATDGSDLATDEGADKGGDDEGVSEEGAPESDSLAEAPVDSPATTEKPTAPKATPKATEAPATSQNPSTKATAPTAKKEGGKAGKDAGFWAGFDGE